MDNAYEKDVLYFCDEKLSDYDKTIYYWAIVYSFNPSLKFDKSDLCKFASFLNVNEYLLSKALDNTNERIKEIVFGNHRVSLKTEDVEFNYFHLIIYSYLIYDTLYSLDDNDCFNSWEENLSKIGEVFHWYEVIYNNLSKYMWIKNEDSFEFYDSPYTPISEVIDLYKTLLSVWDEEDSCVSFDNSLFNLIMLVIFHEIYTRINAIYVFLVCYLVSNTFFIKSDVKSIAKDMFKNYYSVFRNARVISVSINKNDVNLSKSPDDRNRYDNTTQMQFVYGFSNNDDYELRFDFAHTDELFAHFNNASPQKVKCCLFTEAEVNNYKSSNPDLNIESVFISYGTQYALKERKNCDFATQPELKYFYNNMIKSNECCHRKLFNNNYEESDIVAFLEFFRNMLPNKFYREIDMDRELVYKCFTYDRLMRDIELLLLSIMNPNSLIGVEQEKANSLSDKLVEDIKRIAFNKCIINQSELEIIDSLDNLIYIINTARTDAGIN